MAKSNSDWDKLINITDDYNEINQNLTENATQIINVKFNTVKRKNPLIPIIGCGCLIILVIAIVFVALFFLKQPKMKYYEYTELEIISIENINEYLSDNNLDICYIQADTIKSNASIIKENNEIAYINQSGFLFDEFGMDTVNFYIKIADNSKFEFEEQFVKFNDNKIIKNTKVYYSLSIIESGYEFISEFEFKQKNYYLSIKTTESDIDVIMRHLETLITD